MHIMKPARTRLLTRLAAATAGALLLSTAAWAAEPQVSLKTTMGEIVLELDHDKAPKSVDNFLQYVKSGFYKGTIFHRVIDGFMIQGGGMDARAARAARPVRRSRTNPTTACPTLPTPSRWRATATPDTATSQFFINVVDNPGLDYPNMNGSATPCSARS